MGMAGQPKRASDGWPLAGAHSGLVDAPPTNKTVIRLRDIYDPKPQTTRVPVRIRPPSPRIPSLSKGPSSGPCLASSDPPTRPAVRRRARSLSLPAGRRRVPRQGPNVRFIDSMGLELEEVKFFKSAEDPRIPPHVTYRLLLSSELAFRKSPELSLPYFKPCFCDNMAAQADFPWRLQNQKVCLEQVLCCDLGITGSVRVLNLAFEKEVTVRYSFTNWSTHTNMVASWVPGGELDGMDTDTFHFWLPVPPFILLPGAVLEFAICYRVRGCTYWDNNDGSNYKLSCHSFKLTVPRECEDSMLHFT